MMVSRGFGNSTIPVKLFNNPEIVSVDLIGSDAKFVKKLDIPLQQIQLIQDIYE